MSSNGSNGSRFAFDRFRRSGCSTVTFERASNQNLEPFSNFEPFSNRSNFQPPYGVVLLSAGTSFHRSYIGSTSLPSRCLSYQSP
jgi:hypothetical protein